MMKRTLLLALLFLGACRAAGSGPYTTQTPAERNNTQAEQLSRKAADCIDSDPAKAEGILREALTADIFCGAAHNNLGVLYLKQQKLYEAAQEFEWARKLLPGHPDPRLNLAITLERAGRFDEALKCYETALEVASEHIPTIEALAKLKVRMGQRDDRLKALLATIALQGENELWRGWAREEALAGK